MKKMLVVMLALFLSGCGATSQMAEVQQTQQQQTRTCRLQVTYNCPEPVVGQPYSCAPTVTETCATD